MPEGYTHTPQGPRENEKRKSASPGQPAETRCDKLMSQLSGWWVAPGRHTLPRHTGPHRTIKQQSGARGGPMGRGKTQFNLSLHIRYPNNNSSQFISMQFGRVKKGPTRYHTKFKYKYQQSCLFCHGSNHIQSLYQNLIQSWIIFKIEIQVTDLVRIKWQ